MLAETGHPSAPHDENAVFLARVAKAAQFTEQDLAHNREGRLSTTQMIRIGIRAAIPFGAMASAVFGLAGLAIGIAVGSEIVMASLAFLLKFSSYLLMGVGALFFGIVALLVKFVLASGRMFELLLDVIDGKVTEVTGRVSPSRSEELEDGLNAILKRKTESFHLVVKNEYYEIPENAYSVMMERAGSIFRLFITPRSRFLVGLELPAAAASGAKADPFKFRPAEERDASARGENAA